MPDLKGPKMVEMMDFRIFGRSPKPSGPGYRRKHKKKKSKWIKKLPPGPLLDAIFIKYSRGLRPLPKEGGGQFYRVLRRHPAWV